MNSDLQYADGVVTLSTDPGEFQGFLHRLANNVARIGKRFASPKSETSLKG